MKYKVAMLAKKCYHNKHKNCLTTVKQTSSRTVAILHGLES